MKTKLDYTDLVKGLTPNDVRSVVRRYLIRIHQKKVVKELSPIVVDCIYGKLNGDAFIPKKKFPPDAKIIWQYWAQGFESESIPEMVNICLDSVDRYKGRCIVVRLSDQNLQDYIDIPQEVIEKKNHFGIAFYSDLLRTMLLATYGGLWLDACILLTGPISEDYFGKSFFVYQRDDKESEKRYWEHSFSYYWGFTKDFKVRILGGIMSANKNGKIIMDISAMLLEVWRRFDNIPDYFTMAILIQLYFEHNENTRIPIVSDTTPHLLRQYLTGTYTYMTLEQILEKTTVHSLNYKNNNVLPQLKKLLNSIN